MTSTPSKATAGLTSVELEQLRLAAQGTDIRSSDRPSDRARTKLKRLGLLVYERSYARWRITDLGRAAISRATGEA